MRVILTLLVRDEEDILAANLDYHFARGVDFVIATDNRSVDGTADILERYRRQGVLAVIREDGDDYAQGRWVTRMARMAATDFGADWVINGDADEFWWPRDGDLKAALSSVPAPVGVVAAHRINFLPDERVPGPVHRRLVLRETQSRNHLGEPMPSKVCHRADPFVVVEQGNHDVSGPGRGAVLDDGRMEIVHVPLRSYAQFANKISKGGQALSRNKELPGHSGHVWRTLHRAHQEGRLRECYDKLVPGAAALQASLAARELVADDRLPRFLDELAARLQ